MSLQKQINFLDRLGILRRPVRLAAYSLVEISIALVVIGVIIGGAFKGYALIESARLKSVIMQISNYRIAVQNFRDHHDALPGNFSKASTYIDANLRDGRGDGRIAGRGFSESGADHEATSFWAHLSAENLISDVAPRKSGTPFEFGNGLPTTRLGGGFTVEFNPEPGLEGHWLIIGTRVGSEGKGGLFTPKQALAILKQFRNEDPLSGDEQVRDAKNLGSAARCIKGGLLNAQSNEKSCVLYVRL